MPDEWIKIKESNSPNKSACGRHIDRPKNVTSSVETDLSHKAKQCYVGPAHV